MPSTGVRSQAGADYFDGDIGVHEGGESMGLGEAPCSSELC